MSGREDWLDQSVERFRQHFKERGYKLPKKIEVSVGFPSMGVKSSTIGETFPRTASKKGANQIFISPNVKNSVEVLTVLAHELIHAYLDCEFGHTAPFQKIAGNIGLTTPWVEAKGSEAFLTMVRGWAAELGNYPHGGFKDYLVFSDTQKSYLKRVECPDCQYLMRITNRWLAKAVPKCPLCNKEMEVE